MDEQTNDAAQQASQRKILLGTAVVTLLLGLALLAFGVVFLGDANASRGWPAVTGTVENVRVTWDLADPGYSTPNREYYYIVSYSYLVDDQTYFGDRYSLGEGSTASDRYNNEEDARAAASAAYTPSQDITVYYDPADPSSAVLSYGANFGTYVPAVMGALLLLGGAALLWLARKMGS